MGQCTLKCLEMETDVQRREKQRHKNTVLSRKYIFSGCITYCARAIDEFSNFLISLFSHIIFGNTLLAALDS